MCKAHTFNHMQMSIDLSNPVFDKYANVNHHIIKYPMLCCKSLIQCFCVCFFRLCKQEMYIVRSDQSTITYMVLEIIIDINISHI